MTTNLKILRVIQFGSQYNAAKAIGISRPYYAMIETGRLIPTDDVGEKLKTVFKKPIEFLLSPVSKEV